MANGGGVCARRRLVDGQKNQKSLQAQSPEFWLCSWSGRDKGADLMEDQNVLEPYLWPDHSRLAEELNENMPKEYRKLNTMIAQLMDDYSLIAFAKLDISDEEGVAEVLLDLADNAIPVRRRRGCENE